MKSAGIDIASAGWSAIGLLSMVFRQAAFIGSQTINVTAMLLGLDAHVQLDAMHFKIVKPDVIAVEELAVFMNKNVIRSLARHEGVALLAAKRTGPSCSILPLARREGSIRSRQLSKDDSWTTFRKQFTPILSCLPRTVAARPDGCANACAGCPYHS